MEYASAFTAGSKVLNPIDIGFSSLYSEDKAFSGPVSLVGQEAGGPSALDHVSKTFEPIAMTASLDETDFNDSRDGKKKPGSLGWGVKSFLAAQRTTRSLMCEDQASDLSDQEIEAGQFLGGELDQQGMSSDMKSGVLHEDYYSRGKREGISTNPLSSSGETQDKCVPYTYQVVYRGGVLVRSLPDTEAPTVGLIIPYGAVFSATKSLQLDGIVYVKLADGKGWVFEEKGGQKVLERISDNRQGRQGEEARAPATQVSAHFASSGFYRARSSRAHRQQVRRVQEQLSRARNLSDLVRIIENPNNQIPDFRISLNQGRVNGASSRNLNQLQALQQVTSIVVSTGLDIDFQVLAKSLWVLAQMGENAFPIIKRIVKEADSRLVSFGRSHLMQLAIVFSGIGHRIDPLLERIASCSDAVKSPHQQATDHHEVILQGQKNRRAKARAEHAALSTERLFGKLYCNLNAFGKGRG